MMFEYTVIFIAVGWAIWFTARNLWREVKQGQCSHCYCKGKKSLSPVLIQLTSQDKHKSQ